MIFIMHILLLLCDELYHLISNNNKRNVVFLNVLLNFLQFYNGIILGLPNNFFLHPVKLFSGISVVFMLSFFRCMKIIDEDYNDDVCRNKYGLLNSSSVFSCERDHSVSLC